MKTLLKYIAPTVLGIIIGFCITYYWYDEKDDIVTPVRTEPDTLIVYEPVKPDTVYQVRFRKIVKRIVARDTIYIYVPMKTCISKKQFGWPFVQSTVIAYSEAPVDSFDNKIVVDWTRHYKKNIEPHTALRFKSYVQHQKHKYLLVGGAVGILTVAMTAWLIK